MWLPTLLVLSILPFIGSIARNFPPGFKFGAATASYQIEGGWNAGGRGESNWDRMIHTEPASVADGLNADVAADSYHLWRDDIRIAHELGLHFYRFSISWVRILPNGLPNEINKDGVEYYNRLINGLLERGIEPRVTMFHHELPQRLDDLGGWRNPLIVGWFADYVRLLYTFYGDRVKYWITINEPLIICDFTYNTGLLPPRVLDPDIATYLCSKHVLLAHATAWRIYNEEFKPKYHGMLSISNCPYWIEAARPADEELAETARQFATGIYAHPIYSERGGWPPAVEKLMADLSKQQGYPYSRLPAFTNEEIELIKGTHDYYGMNYYSSSLVRRKRIDEDHGVWFVNGSREMNAILYNDPNWEVVPFFSMAMVPHGLRRQIAWINKHYGNLSIFINENGFPSLDDGLDDRDRVRFIRSHLEQVLLAIEDGANVQGYTMWSLLDTFEWISGYRIKFGLYHVDFGQPERKRTPRHSARLYSHIIKHHSLNIPFTYNATRTQPLRSGGTSNFVNFVGFLLLYVVWVVV